MSPEHPPPAVAAAPQRRVPVETRSAKATGEDVKAEDHWLVRDPVRTGFLLVLLFRGRFDTT